MKLFIFNKSRQYGIRQSGTNSSHQTRACARGCSKKMAVAIHLTVSVQNKPFILNILENNLYRFRYLIDILLQ